ncbi:MAG: hypothetical protein KDK51_07245 [Deltaproteobacteria bacterium]|nr:hypothetical protein [Deltaproteobacteria bacterium]
MCQASTIETFDQLFTCPFHGYATPADYYHANSSVFHLSSIQTPVSIIYALDDPFISPEDFTPKAITSNPFLKIMATKYGGHVGFFRSLSEGFQYPYWIMQEITVHAEK